MIPEIGKEYYFFDDGKTSPSRCYKAKVLRVVPYSEKVLVDKDEFTTVSIQDIFREESKNINWIFSGDTDFFIECSISGYDENPIWFARTKDGGWFSMEIQDSWQCGRLDVTGEIYRDVKEFFERECGYNWYDEQLKEKGELIGNGKN